MSRKANRIWAQRSEAIMLLATNPKATAQELVAALYNGDVSSIADEVTTERKGIAKRLIAQHAQQQEIIDAAQRELAGTTSAPTPAATPTQTQGKQASK